jgi:DNA-binding NarL/FixJ family response regulator
VLHVVDNPTDAIAAVENFAPDTILSDYDIVGGTGGDVLAYVQSKHPELVHRYLFISGNDVVQKIHPHWLEKPVKQTQVVEAIAALPVANPGRWQKSSIQSLLFDKTKYDSASAKRWAKSHGYEYGKVDTTEQYHRLRQFSPLGKECRTIELAPHIKAVVCES